MEDIVLSEALTRWGDESQMGMAIEEAAEFIVALRKCSRVGGREVSADANKAVIDEIADITIMARQMALIFGVAEVDQRIKYKIDRLKTRLENSK